MPAFHPRLRAAVVGVSAFALVAIAVGGTVAASNPASLYACYDVFGNVRLSDKATCLLPGGGRLATWGTAAIPGPTGAGGPTGATGPTGPRGDAGSGSTTRKFSEPYDDAFRAVASGSGYEISIACGPTGIAIAVSVPSAAPEGVDFTRFFYDGVAAGTNRGSVATGSNNWSYFERYVDLQVANSTDGSRVTAQYIRTVSGTTCEFLVTS